MLIRADKLLRTRVLRRELRDLYEDYIDADELGVSKNGIQKNIVSLSSRLERLEKSIKKNVEYEGLEWSPPSGYKVAGEELGRCKLCNRIVFSGQKYPDPKEEGLFCNYYCRSVFRKSNRKIP